MSEIDNVISFGREYINRPGTRTPERKATIRKALRSLTGEIVNISCSACYIEAVLKIINNKSMPSSKYELRKGVVLQVFGDPKKTCTNLSITDELGDWYMKNHPEKRIFFSRYPGQTHPGELKEVKAKESPKEVSWVPDLSAPATDIEVIPPKIKGSKRKK